MTQRKLRFVALMILALLGVPGFSQVLSCKGSRKTLGTGPTLSMPVEQGPLTDVRCQSVAVGAMLYTTTRATPLRRG